jgi:hypothetical protein
VFPRASWYTQELVDEPGAVAVLESLLAQLSARFSRAHDFQTSLRSLIDSLAPLRRAAEQALLDMRHIPLDRARAACGACLATPSVVLAQQLTVIESRLYAKVRVTELLPWARERGAATRQAPNLAAAVLRLERVAQWVSSCVLWQTELDKRTAAVAHFLEVATECLGLNNYTSIVQIMTGLQMNCVFRLRRTWKGLSDAHRAKFRALRNLMSSDDNYAAYRSFLATQKPPCVPNLSLYLSDLKRADKSARDAAAAEAVGVVPFAAFRTVSRIVTKIMQWQQYPYALDADPTLVEHMTYVVGMTNAELTLLSTSLEPDVPADGAGGMSPRLGASSSSAAAAAAAANAQLPPHMRQSVTGSPTGSPQPGLPRSNSTSHGRQPIVIEMPPDDAVRPSSPPPPPAEPSASALAAALAADADTSYPFDEDDSRNNIVLSGGSVHAATLSKLVERLTYDQPVTETVFDIAAFERVFFHQYRMLMTPEALLTLLERRFDVPQPPSVTSPADVQKFRLGKQLPIQMKVYNVCHYWAMHFYDEDIGPDAKLEQRFLRFAQRLAQVRGVQDRLTLLLREKRQNYDQRAPIDRAVTSLAGAEPPATAKLLDFTADELARQLSVDHCVLYRTVRLRTVPIGEAKPLASGWPEAALRDPLLGPAAGAWQQLRQWTTTCVARDNDARVRADVIVRLVDVAQRLLEYHNYFAFTAVVHGLASPLVSRSRLPHTWKAVPSRKLDTFVQFAELASTADGFGRVREHMSHARAPTVPHLPTLLYDMAAADAANVADPPAPMVEFRRLQARANALLPLERFKAPLTSYEWYSDGVRSEAAAAEHWGRAAQHVRAYLGTLDTLDNARLAQLVSRHGESGDTVDAPHAEDEGGAGAGEADENGVIDVPVSPRRGGDPSMSPRGRSKRRGATTSAQGTERAVGDRVAECRCARRLLVEEEAHAADGSVAEALFCAQWRIALLLLRSGRRATAERVQAAHDGGQAVEGAGFSLSCGRRAAARHTRSWPTTTSS